ncbi:MAG: hypothetical protein A2X49_08160 [Lentisphaerae bacterium GWF2_52_8]|nr:MAG: hypothetical protein A2X49_08160 [Lentisphaerae bacterium GWF2_52_8]
MPVLPVTAKSFNWEVVACESRFGRICFHAALFFLLVFSGVAGAEETVFRSRGYCATPVGFQPVQNDKMGTILPDVMGPNVPVAVIFCERDGKVKEVVFRTRSFCATSPVQQQAQTDRVEIAPVAATVPDIPLYLFTTTGAPQAPQSGAGITQGVGAGITPGYSSGASSWMSVSPPALPLVPEDFITVAPFPLPATQALTWGPVNIYPKLFYGLYHGNGIQTAPGQQVKTASHVISPGIFLSLGDHWTLDYAPTKTVYVSEKVRDTFDHSVRLSGGTRYENWIFKIEQTYNSSSSPLRETASQTQRELYATVFRLYNPFSKDMAWESEVHQNFQFLEQSPDVTAAPQPLQKNSREWSTLNWVNYQLWPGANVAIGPGIGHISVDPEGVDMTYERLLARMRWKLTDRVYVVVQGGGENWQFANSPVSDQLNPTYMTMLQYAPVETTWLGLVYEHVMSPSYFEGLVTETSTARVFLQQRLLQKLKVIVGAQYGEIEYKASQANAITGTDNFYSVETRLVTPFIGRGTISAMWQFGRNSSTRPGGFGVESSQIGMEVQYQF